jgi:hypothetical protein
MATYGISALVDQFNKQLNTKQRMSSLFAEAPVIAGKVLRRGTEIVLNEAQYLMQKSKLDVLVNAGAIKIRVIGEKGQLKVETSNDPHKKMEAPVVTVKADGPADGPMAPGVPEAAAKLAEEVVTDVVNAVTADPPPPPSASEQPSKPGRKFKNK